MKFVGLFLIDVSTSSDLFAPSIRPFGNSLPTNITSTVAFPACT